MVQSLSFDLAEVEKLFRAHNVFELRGISNRLIREAAIENNYGKAELGVIAYALHKMSSKEHFVTNPQWGRIKQNICDDLQKSFLAAKQDDQKTFAEALKRVIGRIETLDDELGNYAQSIYEKAKVKQASLAYSYGLSIPQVAQLTGADKKDVQSYIGFTTMPDEDAEGKGIIEKVAELRALVEQN